VVVERWSDGATSPVVVVVDVESAGRSLGASRGPSTGD
jgi:hypothetical protein